MMGTLRSCLRGVSPQREDRYRSILEDLTEIICRFAPDGTLTYVNDAYCQQFGLIRDDCIGKRHTLRIRSEDLVLVTDLLGSLDIGHPVSSLRLRVILPSGEERWHHWSVRAIFDEQNALREYQAVGRDITDVVSTEMALQESESRYRHIVEQQTELICRFTPDGTLTYANDAYCRYFGLIREECIGKKHPVVLPRADARRMRAHLEMLTPESPVAYIDHRIIMPSGEVRWQHWSERAIYSPDGRVTEYQSVGRDITDRKKTEEDLRKSEEKYRHVIEHANEAIIVIQDGMLNLINRRAVEFIGYSQDELSSMPFAAFVHPDDRAMVVERYQRRIKGEKVPSCYPFRINTKDGSTRWVEISAVAIDWEGLPATLNFLTDITGRKQSEEAQKESEGLFRSLVINTPDLTILTDENNIVTYVSPQCDRITGYPAEKFVGHLMPDIIYPDDVTRCRQAWEQVAREGQDLDEFEYRIVDARGMVRWISHSAKQVRIDGRVLGIQNTLRDITGRKRVEDALRESEDRYRNIIEDQTEFICRFTPDGHLTFVNDAYCRYFSLDREDCIGKPHSVILPPDDRKRMKDHLAALTPENPVALISHCVQLPSGELRWQRWSDRAIYDGNGGVIEFQSVGRDITGQKMIEAELTRSRENLEEEVHARTAALIRANKQLKKEIDRRKVIEQELIVSGNEKDLLLRELHHRVKNNLQLVVGLIDMTITRTREPNVANTLTDIMSKVQTMGLIHTRLYESKRFDKINMNHHIRDLIRTISGFYSSDHRTIVTRIDTADIYLPVDMAIPCALALNEIFSNVYKHAFKGRREGIMEVSTTIEGSLLRMIVRDNGIGLPTGFDIEKSNRLGLKLVRTLVQQQLHGTMKITGKNGTEVLIEIPVHRSEIDL